MAIRDDNTPPGMKQPTPGSITQKADQNIDRIGNISNVSRTVANMQKDVEQRITETRKQVDDSKSISAVQNSMTTVLDKLAGTVAALSNGVKTITIDTAKATKDSIAQYGKAVSEDISFNKQNVVAMALAKSTPIYGYFVAKFMETDVFKKAAERMKASIGKAFGSIAGLFRRGGKGDETKIPKMHSGGYVKKGGLTELHAGEVVAPIEKILKRIDESISTTKDLVKITDKATMKMAGNFHGYMKSSASTDKSNLGLLRSFIRTYKEVGERSFTERTDERMVRELIAIRRALGGQVDKWEQIWDEMYSNHPYFRIAKLTAQLTLKGMMSPLRFMRAFRKIRGWGGYRAKLSKSKDPAHATAENIASLYVDLMWRLDSMIPLVKLTAQATRDTAHKLTGNTYPNIKGVPKEKRYSIMKGVMKGISVLSGAPLISKMLTAGMKDGKLKNLLTRDILGGAKKTRQEKEKGALPMGAPGKSAGPGGGVGLLVNEITISKISDELMYFYKTQFELLPIEIEYKKRRLEYLTWQETAMRQKIEQRNLENNVLQLGYEETSMNVEKLKKEKKWERKTAKERKVIVESAKSQVTMLGKLGKILKGNRWIKLLMTVGGFISGLLGPILKGLFNMTLGPMLTGLMTILGIGSTGRLIGGGAGLLGGMMNLFGKKGTVTTGANRFFGKEGRLAKIFGKGGSISSFFGKDGSFRKFFSKGGGLSQSMASIFGKGGFLRQEITGIGGMFKPGPLMGVIAAAGIGVAIGTWLNDSFITPFLGKIDKRNRDQQIANQKVVDAAQSAALGKAKSKDLETSARGAREMAAVTSLRTGEVAKVRQEQMEGRFFGLGDNDFNKITTAQDKYITEHLDEYLMYSEEERDALRIKWIKEGRMTTRGFMGNPAEYGWRRENAFLAYLRMHGKKITDTQLAKKTQAHYEKSKKHFAPVDAAEYARQEAAKAEAVKAKKAKEEAMRKEAQKIQVIQYREAVDNWTWSGPGSHKIPSKTGAIIANLQKKKDKIEDITVKKISQAKGLGQNWLNKLDGHSRAAFQEAKKFYIKDRGMTEAEADLELQKLALRVGDRIDLMSDPKTYKTFLSDVHAEYQERMPGYTEKAKGAWGTLKGKYDEKMPGITAGAKSLLGDIKDEYDERSPGYKKLLTTLKDDIQAEYRERMPGVVDKTKMLIGEAQIELASGEKAAAAFAEETVKQTKELVNTTRESVKETGVTMINATNHAINNVTSSTVVGGGGSQLPQGNQVPTMEYFNSIVYTLDTD